MVTAEIKPGQHRALLSVLSRKRCPGCNRHGSVTTSRHLQTACMHCGRLLHLAATFDLVPQSGGKPGKWTATITKLEV
jgi:hypothetical protein